MDFTLKTYHSLLTVLLNAGYTFYTFEQFMSVPPKGKIVVLRHDIDKKPQNALILAEIEHQLGIKASDYIRVVKGTWNENIIRKIVALGHEVSYHYEDLSITKGDYKKAWEHFKENMAKIREFYPAKTICMHGSPLSKWDNRKLWEKYNYREIGIIGEPYFDVDYSKVLYITDTGRGWSNAKVSVRDKIANSNKTLQLNIKNTQQMIEMIESNCFPNYIIINTHPQRWFPFGINWMKELLLQALKNRVKRILILIRTN
ncbi:hypothetical protein [uncultured Bacteroides sp.]|uniref:hypothetical protein n=1 Tax=uncultured Bacteroides sp. TaxID=162156 RepID=UPI002AA8E8CE|nr:hypothetical protein [uncultured Bacteroides sp.]